MRICVVDVNKDIATFFVRIGLLGEDKKKGPDQLSPQKFKL